MKVLFLVRDLAVGGSQRQLAVLAAGLARHGHDVAVAVLYTGGALEGLLGDSGVRLLSIGKASRWHVMAPLVRLRRLFQSERPDLVYAFLPMQTTLAALLLPARLETKLVFGLRAGRAATIAAFVPANSSPTVAQVQAMSRSAKRSSKAGTTSRTPRMLAP